MNSTQMRNAIAKALGLDPSQIHVVDVDVEACEPAPEISEDGYYNITGPALDELDAEIQKLDAMTGGYPPISGTWAMSQKDREDGIEKLKAAIHPDQPKLTDTNLWAASTAQLKQQITNLQVANRELATRNDRQAATINDLHEKIAGSEALADKKAMRKSLAEDISLAQALIGEIFDEHAALTNDEIFLEDVLENINTELDLISQRLYNLGQYVNRAL